MKKYKSKLKCISTLINKVAITMTSLCSNLFFLVIVQITEKKKCWMDVDCVIHIFIMIYLKNKNSMYIFNTFWVDV